MEFIISFHFVGRELIDANLFGFFSFTASNALTFANVFDANWIVDLVSRSAPLGNFPSGDIDFN